MAESQHTPGPWVADGPVIEPFDAPFSPDIACTMRVGYIWQLADAPDLETAEANARLIAAAPELLAALEDAMKIVELLQGLIFKNSPPIKPVIVPQKDDWRAVIAKAKGEVDA